MQLQLAENVWSVFATYSSLLLMKLLLMAMVIAKRRYDTKVFINPEDAAEITGGKTGTSESVERVRRAHLNDIENIYAFVLLGFLYCLTGPSYGCAVWVFRVFAAARFLHTVAYLHKLPQPSRALAFATGVVCCAYMGVNTVIAVARF